MNKGFQMAQNRIEFLGEEIPVRSIELLIASLRRVIIFGAGSGGRDTKRFFEKRQIEIVCFADNDLQKHGTHLDGVPVVNPNTLTGYNDEIAIAIASDWSRDIALQLRLLELQNYFYFGLGFDDNRFCKCLVPAPIQGNLNRLKAVFDLVEDIESKRVFLGLLKFRLSLDPAFVVTSEYPQYMHPQVRPENGYTIIDGGAFNGDSASDFLKAMNGQGRVFSFEPSRNNFNQLLERIVNEQLSHTVKAVNAGLWRARQKMYLRQTSENAQQFQTGETGETAIDVMDLDSFVIENGLRVDLIKMDIEGAESQALQGSKRTISEQHPRLQICLYHLPDDLWSIPLWLKDLNSQYRFHLGHHSQHLFDTVLYCHC
jgi:FkbM family methyltransferase